MSLRKLAVNFFLFFVISFHARTQPFQVSNEFVHENGITVMTKDPSNKLIIAGDVKGNLYFHNLISGELEKKIVAHGAEVCQLRFNSTGKLLISATHDGEIKIYDFNKEKIIQAIFSPDYSGIRFVLFSIADGFIYFNGNKRLYKTRSDLTQKVNEVFTEVDTLTDAVITNDRSALIFSSGTHLKVLNTRTDMIMQDFNTGASKIEKIALVRDTLLATWSRDGTINFWNYNFGQINPKPLFFLKAGNPAAMNFSDDGKLMCSGNIGNWARVWKPLDRNIVQELFTHSMTVTSSSFGISNDELFTGSLDGKIILWKKGVVKQDTPVKKNEIVIEKEEPVKTVTQLPEVIMTESNIPKIISGRTVISEQRFEVNSPILTVYVYDNSYIDGDTMSLYFNGKWILHHYGVTKKKYPLQLNLEPNTNNYLVLFANTLGKSPPNTAVIEFDYGGTKKYFKLSADLKNCRAINFFYRK